MISVEESVAARQVRNSALVESLQSRGVDVFEKRAIDLQFRAPSSAVAWKLSEMLGSHGFESTVRQAPPGPGGRFDVLAQFNGSIMEVTAVGFVERYVKLAAEHSAEFDGWGTSV